MSEALDEICGFAPDPGNSAWQIRAAFHTGRFMNFFASIGKFLKARSVG